MVYWKFPIRSFAARGFDCKVSIVAIAIAVIIFNSCRTISDEKDLYGKYVPINYKNTYDTITLKPDSLYLRKVCDKDNNVLLEMKGKWFLEDNSSVTFEPFYLNFDDDLHEFPELVSDTSMTFNTIIESKGKKIGFCVGHYEGTFCYENLGK